MNFFDQIKSAVWLSVILALTAIVGVQSWRLQSTQLEFSKYRETTVQAQKDLADKYAKALAQNATDEHAHQLKTTELSHALATEKDRNAADLRTRTAAAKRLLDGAETRHASYRAQAESGDIACGILADRTQVLDGLVTEGIGLVTEGRGLVADRDAEIAYLKGYALSLRRLLDEGDK